MSVRELSFKNETQVIVKKLNNEYIVYWIIIEFILSLLLFLYIELNKVIFLMCVSMAYAFIVKYSSNDINGFYVLYQWM